MSALSEVVIEGVGFWASRLPGWELACEVIRGERAPPEEIAPRPAPVLLAPTERRRAPDSVAVALEVAARACASSGRAPAELPAVFASTHGDLAINDYMCTTLASTPALISPTKFHNSVHNAAAGYWSIAVGSHVPYTALSAFHHTFGAGLLEAAVQAVCEHRPVLYVAFDVEAKGSLATMAPSRGLLGAGLVLAPRAAAKPGTLLRLEVEAGEAVGSPASSQAAPLVADNALAPCMAFFEALARRAPAALTLTLSARSALRVRIE